MIKMKMNRTVLRNMVICVFVIGLCAGLLFPTNDAYARISLLDLQNQINDLQDQINNLTPGPEGPAGPAGPPGECDCPITQEQLDELYDRIEYLENNALIPRFTDMGDGTIRDNETGLIWLKDANAFGVMTWWDAMDEASNLSSGEHGLSDGSVDGAWRLPTKEEWEAFYSTVYDYPALVNSTGILQWSEGDAFTGVQSYYYYWSGTEYDSIRAWVAYMVGGLMYGHAKDDNGCVWPVRSGND